MTYVSVDDSIATVLDDRVHLEPSLFCLSYRFICESVFTETVFLIKHNQSFTC